MVGEWSSGGEWGKRQIPTSSQGPPAHPASAQALRRQWTSPPSLPLRPKGSDSLHGTQSRGPGPHCLGSLRSLRSSWVLGTWLPQRWQLGRVWGPGPEWATNWDPNLQPGLGTGVRTQTGCWMNDLGQGNCPLHPLQGPPTLGHAWTSKGESCALGPSPILSVQRVTFVWCRFTGTSYLTLDLTSRTKDLTPRSLQQLATPLPHLSYERALFKAFWEFGVFLRQETPISLHSLAINLSVFQTPAFWYCLTSLCIGHTDLHFGKFQIHSTWKLKSQLRCLSGSIKLIFLLTTKNYSL